MPAEENVEEKAAVSMMPAGTTASDASKVNASQVASIPQPSAPAPAASASSSTSSRPPPPKKKKSTLGAKAKAAAPTVKVPKLNTLERSKLDWESYKQKAAAGATAASSSSNLAAATSVLTQEERDEMESQTRAGGSAKAGQMSGYLDRADFLDRVSERVEAAEDEQRKVGRHRR
ncbi:hypothetical protein OC834_006457 [Tilletia horrida]|nr:hypothetical protein OC834_006457 [Tilletia horrida]